MAPISSHAATHPPHLKLGPLIHSCLLIVILYFQFTNSLSFCLQTITSTELITERKHLYLCQHHLISKLTFKHLNAAELINILMKRIIILSQKWYFLNKTILRHYVHSIRSICLTGGTIEFKKMCQLLSTRSAMLTNAKHVVLALFSKSNLLGPTLWEYVRPMAFKSDKKGQQPAGKKKRT